MGHWLTKSVVNAAVVPEQAGRKQILSAEAAGKASQELRSMK